jgi:hypothetical protein
MGTMASTISKLIASTFGPLIFVNVVRAIVTLYGWNLLAGYFGFRPITFLIALGFTLSVDIAVDTVNRLRK